MPDEPADHIRCASYTHARRHPLVIGKIAGWTPPFQLSLTQLVVLLVVALAMAQTWRLWARPLPPAFGLVVGVGVPVGLTWAVRRVRVEGRSLARAALGWLALWSTPSAGVVLGRPHRDRRAVALGTVRMNVAGDLPPTGAAPAAAPPGRRPRTGAAPAAAPADGQLASGAPPDVRSPSGAARAGVRRPTTAEGPQPVAVRQPAESTGRLGPVGGADSGPPRLRARRAGEEP